MIKFFRKIRLQALSNSKANKYLLYALGEIILVVIGILIALYVSNLNEVNKVAQSIEDHLEIFTQNLKEDQSQLAILTKNMDENVHFADTTMQMIRTEIPINQNLKKHLTLLVREFEFRPNRNAIETITQSNEIPFLNPELQTAILDYYALIERTNERENISNHQIQLRYEPYIMDQYPVIFQRDNTWDYIQTLYKNDPRQPIPIDKEKFLADRTLEALLLSRYYQTTQLRDFYSGLKDSVDALMIMIRSELQK